jgi:tRNA A-37 threonylcarbamoyl transferase component Bud32
VYSPDLFDASSESAVEVGDVGVATEKLPGGSRRLGNFELLSVVGMGAFGTVYKARDPVLDRMVAVKVPRTGNLSGAPEVKRFLSEARTVSRLRHPGIVPIHEIGQHDEVPFLVSEYVEGITLADLLTARRPSLVEAARLVGAVAEALQYAHANGVIHRDVKPSNLILGEDGLPHLTDFGLAQRDVGEGLGTAPGQIVGTRAFMSPEQMRGEAPVDARSDIYSLGVILYQLLTGELPFRGSPRMIRYQVLNEEPLPPHALNPAVPAKLEEICLKAMAKDPDSRFASAGELAAALARFLAGKHRLAGKKVGSWLRRYPLTSTIIAAAILLAAGAATIKWLGGDNSPVAAEQKSLEGAENVANIPPPVTPKETAPKPADKALVDGPNEEAQAKAATWQALVGEGLAHAQLDQWELAGKDFGRALAIGKGELKPHQVALLHLAAGDAALYQQDCRGLMESLGPAPDAKQANRAAWICVLCASSGMKPEQVVELARKTAKENPAYDPVNTLGAALFRAGRYEEAAAKLEEAITIEGRGGAAWDWLFLAMTLQKAGQVETARAAEKKAEQLFQDAQVEPAERAQQLPWDQQLELYILHREMAREVRQ